MVSRAQKYVTLLAGGPVNLGRITRIFAKMAALVNSRKTAGQNILLASMSSVLASDFIDWIRPTDAGRRRMGELGSRSDIISLRRIYTPKTSYQPGRSAGSDKRNSFFEGVDETRGAKLFARGHVSGDMPTEMGIDAVGRRFASATANLGFSQREGVLRPIFVRVSGGSLGGFNSARVLNTAERYIRIGLTLHFCEDDEAGCVPPLIRFSLLPPRAKNHACGTQRLVSEHDLVAETSMPGASLVTEERLSMLVTEVAGETLEVESDTELDEVL
ncbi:hypothetical protein B0H14DRAFT_2643281 [Mycena olivaceomarginata]|nr:hypothetical protein B0H14DRAFT_2643281 [Mycena olivaceomarginata]